MTKKLFSLLGLTALMLFSGCAGDDPDVYYDADWSDYGGDLPDSGDSSADTAQDTGDSATDTGDSVTDTGDTSTDTGDPLPDEEERPRPDEGRPLPDSDQTGSDDDPLEPDSDRIEPDPDTDKEESDKDQTDPDKDQPETDADEPETDADQTSSDADQTGSDDDPQGSDEEPTSQETCRDNSDCRASLGEACDPETHECVQASNCYAAIHTLPHGGFYDWDDATPQGFQTNDYWQVREGISKSGNYSFGFYSESKYSPNMNYSSLLPMADLSSCAACDVAVTFYHAGTIAGDDNPVDFAHPMCNGTGITEMANSHGYTTPAAPSTAWQYANYSYSNKYPKVSDNFQHQRSWDIPTACKASQFVFGVRFWSNSMLEGTGIVFDDLKIAPKAAESTLPTGALTELDQERISGWACDPDRDDYLLVQLRYYKNGDKTQAPVVKNIPANLTSASALCSSAGHGFAINHGEWLMTALGSGTHAVEVYAFDLHATKNQCGSGYVKIAESSLNL